MIFSPFPVAKSFRPAVNAALLIASLVLAHSTLGELIPAARLTNWTPGVRTGVIGGIPTNRTNQIDVTRPPYNADKTGATDTRAAIQAAIEAAPAGAVVYLPAGTYRIDGTLSLGTNFSGKTLRGAGPGATIIDQRANVGLSIGSTSGLGSPNPPVLVTAGLTKGSTTVTVNQMDFDQAGGAHGFTVGQIIDFNVQNDPVLPVASVYSYDVFTNQGPTNQLVRITAVNTTAKTLTFSPPLFDAYGGGNLQVRVQYTVFQAIGIGLEDLAVDAANFNDGTAFNCVQFNNAFGSWVKNCHIRKAKNYNLYLQDCLNCEVRHSTLSGSQLAGTNGSGLLFNMNSSCLIEDNIILDSWPLVEINMGASGNVFAYNFSADGMWDTNHAPHNQFNLYEGNAIDYQLSDGYFGGEAYLTFFRNYIRGAGINLRRWSRNVSAVGNMLPHAVGDDGYPNMGNIGFDGTAQLSAGDPWRDWNMAGTLTTRTDDSTGAITLNAGFVLTGDSFHVIRLVWGTAKDQSRFALVPSVTGNVAQIINYTGGTVLPPVGTVIYVGPGAFYNGSAGSYQEKDLDVAATTIKKGNRYADDNSFESLGGDTLPASLFRLSKPSWFNDLTWPPFDPVTPRAPNNEHIPAGYRYVHGVDPPGGTATAPQPPTGVTIAPSPGAWPPTDRRVARTWSLTDGCVTQARA